MHLAAIFSAFTLLAAGVTAAVTQRQNDPHLIDFRTWGGRNCSGENQGIWTFTESDHGRCRSFQLDYGLGSVQSLTLVDLALNWNCKSHPSPWFVTR